MKRDSKKDKIIIGVLLLLLTPFVTAELTGVAKDYLKGNTLYLNSGDIIEYHFRIQNMGYEDTKVYIEMLEGHNYTEINKTEYDVPARTTSTDVTIKITAPQLIGNQTLPIKLKFTSDAPSGNEGNVVFSKALESGISVFIIGEKIVNPTNTSLIIGIILLVICFILGGILYWVIKKK